MGLALSIKESEVSTSQGKGTPLRGYNWRMAVDSENCRKGRDSLEDLHVEFMEDEAGKTDKVRISASNTKTPSFHSR